MKFNRLYLIFTFLLCLSGNYVVAATLPVVASFSILGDVVHQIGGNRVTVQTLIASDQDAHVYQLNSKDLRLMRQSKLIMLNGLGFEPLPLQRAAQQSHIPVYYATENIQAAPLAEHDHSHEHHHDHDHSTDPHVWHDPILMQTYAQNVANALIKVDPAGKAYYQQQLKQYQQQLSQLNQWTENVFNAIPVDKRKVLTGHDAFGYMAHRYQIKFLAPQGVSTEAEPSARQVAAIIRQIREQHIKAVFTENIKDPRMVKRIADETGVHISGHLYSDALSQDKTASTYINMFRYNVNALSHAMK